ncbi:MAG: hypothetical protein AAF589_01970 [Planctomycetota bacterium]
MTFFLENATPYLVAGALGLTVTGIVYSFQRTAASLIAMMAVVLLTTVGLLVEYNYQTPREEVRESLRSLLDAIEADDVPGVLAHLAPSASEMRADAEELMPEFEIEKARATGEIEVLMTPGALESADAVVKVAIRVKHRRSGVGAPSHSPVNFHLVKPGDRWLVESYSVSEDWRRGAAELRSGR